jgi:hypothetical protein
MGVQSRTVTDFADETRKDPADFPHPNELAMGVQSRIIADFADETLERVFRWDAWIQSHFGLKRRPFPDFPGRGNCSGI